MASYAIIGFALLPPASVAAEGPPQIKLVASGFSESYLKHPVVSGNLVVGVRWRGGDGLFDPRSVMLPVSPAIAGGTACVDIASKDGRYAAANLYTIDKGVRGGAPLEMRTQYARELVQYPLGNMAVMVRKAASCDPAEAGQIVPAVLSPIPERGATVMTPPTEDGRDLIVDVNADADKVVLRLSGPPGPDVPADCQPAGEGVRIAFSTRCVVAVPDTLRAGAYVLILTVRERFEKVETRLDLLLDDYP